MTVPPFLSRQHRARHAEAARFERDERARLYPARVRDGKIPAADAEGDWLAWVAIARWCAGEPIGFDISFDAMDKAAARALQMGEGAAAKAPADRTRAARRDAVAAIHGLLNAHRAFIDDLNLRLRERAQQARAAA